MAEPVTNLLREIPSVDRILKHANCEALLARYNRDYVTQKCREVLERLRAEIRADTSFSPGDIEDEAVIKRLEANIRAESVPGHVRVVNATGTILHTNLGRALLPQVAIDAMTAGSRLPGQPRVRSGGRQTRPA